MNAIRKYRVPILHLLAILFIGYLSVHNIENLNTITVLNDEFGYWSNAALAAHLPWVKLAQRTPYYSFGYSIVLIPLFWVFSNTALMYKAAIVLNCIMLICDYTMAYNMIKRIYAEANEISKILAALAAVLLCTNLLYSQIAWSECFFTSLFWFLVFCIFKLEQKFSYMWFIGASLTEILLFITHQRAIGIFIPFVISLVLLLKTRKKATLWIVCPILVVLIAYLSQRLMANYQNQLIESFRITNKNDLVVSNDTVSSYWNKIISNIIPLVDSICGKISVLLFSTMGLALVLFVNWWSETIQIIKYKKRIQTFYALETFVVISMMIMLALQSVQVMEEARKDIVVYSRYFDFVFGPVILLAINRLNSKKNIILMLIGVFMSMVGFWFISKYSWPQSPDYFNVSCSPLIGGVDHWCGISNVVIVLIWICICCFILGFSIKTVSSYKLSVAICVLGIIVNIVASYYANDWINPGRELSFQKTLALDAILEDYYDRGPIVYLCNEDIDVFCNDMKFLQFVAYDNEIIVKDDEKELIGMQNYCLIVNKNDDTEYRIFDNDEYELIGGNSDFDVYYVF